LSRNAARIGKSCISIGRPCQTDCRCRRATEGFGDETSAAKPDFYRIYRFELASDVARSTATNVDRVSKVSLKATGAKIAPLFDGSQQLIAVTSVPWYSRQVSLPGS
jgi:hypothetical protein